MDGNEPLKNPVVAADGHLKGWKRITVKEAPIFVSTITMTVTQ